MTLGKFVIKVDGVNDLTREIRIWDPVKKKFYDFETWRMNNEIILVPKLEREEADTITAGDRPEKEGGCSAW